MIADTQTSLPSPQKATPLAWLFLACCAARIVLFWRGLPFGTWPDLALALATDVVFLVILAHRLPPQNWVSLAIFIFSSGAFVEAHSKPFLIGLPAAWVGILLGARELARWLLRPWRQRWSYGFWLIGLAGILCGCSLTGVDLLITSTHPAIQGLLLRTAASMVILVLATLVIISKRPAAEVLEKDTLLAWVGISVVLLAATIAKLF